MNANLHHILSALPVESGDPADAMQPEELQRIFEALSDRPVPAGSLHRMWTAGELSAQIALAYFALWVRHWFAGADQRKRQTMETNLRLALKIFHRLSYLRGVLMKLGQTAGSFPQIFPPQIAETLDRLHFEAPPMHYSLVREVLAAELGDDPARVFATFQTEAFAAASIGQVHRATLKTGEEVAVKIQYPGIARAIDSDIRTILFPLRLGAGWDSLKPQFDEVYRMLRREVDYEHEAETARRIREVFQNDEAVVVPRVHSQYSTKRVLTMDFIPGLHLPAFLATNPSQPARDRYGALLLTVWYRLHAARMNHADPQSGNYLFLDDGRLGLIDFGCVQEFSAEEFEILRLAYRLGQGGEAAMREHLRKACNATEEQLADPEFLALMNQCAAWMLEPVQHPGPFDFGDGGHLQRGFAWMVRVAEKRFTKSHPMYIYFNRTTFALKSILYRLGARVDLQTLPVEKWWL